MKRPHWFKFLEDNKLKHEYEISTEIILYVREGRHRGRVGRLIEVSPTKATLRFEDGVIAAMAYTRVELTDENQQPVMLALKDMMGESLDIGSFVCYSQSTAYSHALEIGRIRKIGNTGTLVIEPLVRNGKRYVSVTRVRAYTSQQMRKVNAERCLKLPVDPARLMMGVMTDFESIETDMYG